MDPASLLHLVVLKITPRTNWVKQSCWRELTKKTVLWPRRLVITWISHCTSLFLIEEILTQSRSGDGKKRKNLGKSCRILQGNEVSWFVSRYHSLHCLSISKEPWLSEFLMATLSSCAALVVEQNAHAGTLELTVENTN